METKQERIVHQFKQDHKRLLGSALLTAGTYHPNDIQISNIGLSSTGMCEEASAFTASFTIGKTSVFYFGTINDQLEIANEGVAGRSSDNTASQNSLPGFDLNSIF